ncbi:minor capsid protein [Acinetobacter brisouii]|uniref:minor capsid protein n=1 Tax=Acinetobacter brisouii TaxID=396323 RepID=UPI00124CA9E7|nr:minor capsid protein [Acinetobacter brisouii]
MNLLDFAKRLQDQKVGVMGKTLFINMLPIEVGLGVLLRNSLEGTAIDYELPNYSKGAFQIIVRAPSYPAGEALINQVTAALTINSEPVGGYFVNYARPRTEPVVFPLSVGNLLEFSVYVDVNAYRMK